MKIADRLDRGFLLYQKEFEEKALEVLRSGWYVLGKEVRAFEEEFAQHLGAQFCVGLASGLDALYLGMRALGITAGDEVIVQANTYIASVMGITMNGAVPIFVEPNAYHNIDVTKIEEKITPRTRAILVVHLYGQAAKMDDVMALAQKYGLYVVEDCAQSHDASFAGQKTGTFGDVGCFSFYPTKNLGAFGDGGAIVTNRAELAEHVQCLRNYGSRAKYHFDEVGVNSRLDELQAGLLRVKLRHLEELAARRLEVAEYYSAHIQNGCIEKPAVQPGATSVWHQYVIRCRERDRLQAYLEENGISTMIHYPVPPHLSRAYQHLNIPEGSLPITEEYAQTLLSLPIYSGITEEEMRYVVGIINQF